MYVVFNFINLLNFFEQETLLMKSACHMDKASHRLPFLHNIALPISWLPQHSCMMRTGIDING